MRYIKHFLNIILLSAIGLLSASTISEQQVFFNQHGYLVVRDFFSAEEASTILEFAQKWGDDAAKILNKANETSLGKLIVVPERDKPGQVCRVEDLLSYEPGFDELVRGRVTAFISNVLGEEYTPFKDKLNFKWPGGGAFPPHQDFPAYAACQPDFHVTAMISIDPATEENGYLYFAHNWQESIREIGLIDPISIRTKKAILPYYHGGRRHGTIKDEIFDKLNWIGQATSPRDLVIFDSFLPHYSKPNGSSKPRRAIFITHNRLCDGEHKETYYDQKRRDPQNPNFHFATPTK